VDERLAVERVPSPTDVVAWKNTSRFTTGKVRMFRTMSISGRVVTTSEYRSDRTASKSSGTEETAFATYPCSTSFETITLAAPTGRNTRMGFSPAVCG
jgi:hypothetical protein